MLGSLSETVDYDHKVILDFFEEHPDLHELLDAMIVTCRHVLQVAVHELRDGGEYSAVRLMLWRTMYDYTETSLLLLLKTRMDEGYVLLRMAAELCRDIARIVESRDNYEMWKKRAELHNDDRYKSIFRFNTNDPVEKHVFRLYNLASLYGVHGHQTRDVHLGPLGEVVGDHVMLRVSERAKLEGLDLRFFSFFPLHSVAARTFSSLYSALNPNPLEHFATMESQIMPLLKEFRKNVKAYYPKRP